MLRHMLFLALLTLAAQVEDQALLLDIGAGKVRVLKQFVGGEFKEKGTPPVERCLACEADLGAKR